MFLGKRIAIVQESIELRLRVFHQITIRATRGIHLARIALCVVSLIECLLLI